MKIYGNQQTTASNQIASFVQDFGTPDAYQVNLRPAVGEYTTGLMVCFRALNANTGASTLSVNGLAAMPIKKSVDQSLEPGDILAGAVIITVFDGTQFQLQANHQEAFVSEDTQTVDLQGDGTASQPLQANVNISDVPGNSLSVLGNGLYVPSTIKAGVVYGGIVSWISGYTYHISAAGYYINGVFYSSPETTITLSPADSTYNRIDTFIVDDQGVASVLQGTPSSNPAQAPLDPASQLQLSIALVEAGTTAPSTPGVECIYKENVEWNTLSSNTSRLNPNNITSPNSGAKSISATAVVNGDNIVFSRPLGTPLTLLSGFSQLLFYIKSKGAWGGNGNKPRKLDFRFRLNGTALGSTVSVYDGVYGFNSSNTASYQIIALPLTAFGLSTSQQVNELQITVSTNNGSFGFYLDDMCMQGTPTPPPATAGTSGTSGSSGIGLPGTSGTSGISGLNGTSGVNGINGTSGISGTSGVSGTSGITGTSGTSGISGTNGITGTSGTSGSSGLPGAAGTSGTSAIGSPGTSGTSGVNGTSGTSATGSGLINVQDEGVDLTPRTKINFIGSNVTAVDNATTLVTDVTVTPTPPALPFKSVQFNDSGAFGGDANFTWDKAIAQAEINGKIYVHKNTSNINNGVVTGLYWNTVNWNATTSEAVGSVYAANFNMLEFNQNANMTYDIGSNNTALLSLLRLGGTISSSGTVAQNGGTAINRALSSNGVYVQLNSNATGINPVFSHVAGVQVLGPQATNGAGATATNLGLITNYYGVLIGPSDEYSNASSRITNRYGLYQSGLSDKNYLAGEITAKTVPTYSTGGYNLVVWNSTTNRLENVTAGSLGGLSAITADNGLTANTSSNVQLGGTTPGSGDLLHYSYIDPNGFYIALNGARGTTYLQDNSIAINATSTDNIPLSVNWSGTSGAASIGAEPSSTNSVVPAMKLYRNTSGTADDGIGVSLVFSVESTAGSPESNTLVSKYTTALDATRTSQFEIYGVNNAVTARKLAIAGSGQLILDNYVSTSSFTGTQVATLGVDASGNVITVAPVSGGLSAITADNGLTANTSSNVRLGGTLLQNTDIVLGANYLTLSGGTNGTQSLKVTNTSSGIAIFGQSASAPAGQFNNTGAASPALQAYASGGAAAATLNVSPSTTNTIANVLNISRGSSGTPANNIGASINYNISTITNPNGQLSNQLVSKWTNATDASRTSQFEIIGVNAATSVSLLKVGGEGFMNISPITATAASAITPSAGMIVFVNSTNATFTSVGFWGFDGTTWNKF